MNNKINFCDKIKYLGNINDNHLNLNEDFNCLYKRGSTQLRLLEHLREDIYHLRCKHQSLLIYDS